MSIVPCVETEVVYSSILIAVIQLFFIFVTKVKKLVDYGYILKGEEDEGAIYMVECHIGYKLGIDLFVD